MQRLTLSELERRCQKPNHGRIGNWVARRISRPAALRITRVIAPWGISANTTTFAAWACGMGAAAALGWGSVWGWLLGAALLQAWYLLDHVDGQLARLRGTASLDGVQLDYLMHHTVNLLVPMGVGFGVFARSAEPLWVLGGVLWGVSLLGITLQHDARYKAFVQRLKRVRGRLLVEGGGGFRPAPQPPIPRSPLRLAAWTGRKACETHVMINVLALLALGQLAFGDAELMAARLYLLLMAPAALITAAWTIVRSQETLSAEREFAAWYSVPPGSELIFSDGWWIVQRAEDGELGEDEGHPSAGAQQSS